MDEWNVWEGQDFDGPDVSGLIDVKFRDGVIFFGQNVEQLWWDHNGADDDIIEWRLNNESV